MSWHYKWKNHDWDANFIIPAHSTSLLCIPLHFYGCIQIDRLFPGNPGNDRQGSLCEHLKPLSATKTLHCSWIPVSKWWKIGVCGDCNLYHLSRVGMKKHHTYKKSLTGETSNRPLRPCLWLWVILIWLPIIGIQL